MQNKKSFLDYCNKRIERLISQMTLKEKVSQLWSNSCAIKRLKIPPMIWGGECLHGLVHTGIATQFPMPLNLASTFDPLLIKKIGDAIATEARAKHHSPEWQGKNGPIVGLNFWSPNINILRDPRWGRSQETWGEDPFLTGLMASYFVKGLQGDHPFYLKVAACAKHFAVHSGPERLRTKFDAKVSKKDLWETYLPAFKTLVDAKVESVMATYNRVNGEPCPTNVTLLKDILRKQWNFEGHVVADGGALSAAYMHHKRFKTPLQTAVAAIKAGCDLSNDGYNIYENLIEAVQKKIIPEELINESLKRVLLTRFKLGIFDPPKKNPYTKIPSSVIRCKKHLSLAKKAAVESIVLLKNNGILPISPKFKIIGVTGPVAADAEILLGNYYRGVSPHLYTILEGIVSAAPKGTVIKYLPGSYSAFPNLYPSGWHIGMIERSELAIVVVGFTPLMEGEQGECIGSKLGGDRESINLPDHQAEFIRELKNKGKPIILLVSGGSPVAIGEFHKFVDAVLWLGYPGEQGGLAAGEILFGKSILSGRLPVTFPFSDKDLPDFSSYSMKGRTYRFMKKEPLYPFGFGLSYSKFLYIDANLSKKIIRKGESIKVEVTLKNIGRYDAFEVVQLYIKDEKTSVKNPPLFSLKSFKRVKIKKGKSKKIFFKITPEMMSIINESGKLVLEPGWFTLFIGGSLPSKRSEELGASKPLKLRFCVKE